MTTTQRAAMTAAVTALENCIDQNRRVGNDGTDGGAHACRLADDAASLLRAALAEPEWQPIEPAPPEGE